MGVDVPLVTSKSAKGQIIDILSREFPLSAMRIYNRAKKRHQCGIRYRTFHKHVVRLWEEGVVSRDENHKEYYLNSQWTKNVAVFANFVHNKVISNMNIFNIDGKKTFGSYKDMMSFFKNHRNMFLETAKEGDEILCLTDSPLLHILDLGDRRKMADECNKRKIQYFLALRGKTPLDKFKVKYYNGLGLNAKHGVNDKSKMTMFIYGDVAFVITRDPSAYKMVNSIENRMKNVKSIDSNEFSEIVDKIGKYANKKFPHFIHRIEDPIFVNTWKEHIKSFFR